MGGCSALLLLLSALFLRSVGTQRHVCGAVRDSSADLSHRNLTRVPGNLPNDTRSLDLSFNSIASLDRGDLLNMPDLCYLSLSHNRLKSIQAQTFQRNPRLQILNLSSNALNALPDLGGLPSLRVLDLSENHYDSYSLVTSYGSLRKLSSLYLGSPIVTCIKRQDFSALSSSPLEVLYLGSGAEMEEYQVGSLAQLTSLRELTLNMRFCAKPTVLQDILRDLHGSNVVNLTIVRPHLCNISVADPFEELKYMRNLRKVTVMDIHEKCSVASSIFCNILQSQVDSVFLINLFLSYDPPFVIDILRCNTTSSNIRNVVLINNNGFDAFWPIFNINFKLISNLEVLRVINQGIMIFPWSFLIPELPNLHVLDFSQNLLDVNTFDTLESKSIRHLILQSNNLDDLRAVVNGIHNVNRLESLDLSANRITLQEIPSWPSHITHLSLSENQLGNNVFVYLSPYFLSVNLSKNDIVSLSQDTLGSLKDLKSLFLSSNRMAALPTNLNLNLEELHLDNNTIKSLHKEYFTGLPKLKKLKAGNNPFACDCNLYWFVSTFNKSILLDWPSDYTCASPARLSGTLLKDFHPGRLSCDPMMQVAVFLPLTVCVCIALGLLFHAVDGAWYLRMLWVWLTVKRRGQKERERLLGANLRYHAFISYSQRDSYWVNSQLIANLEGEHFSLCVHERDFVPGRWIIDNIVDCVEGSYKTIFVLSQNFVKSEWCNYELFFSQHRDLSERQNSMVFVLLEPIPGNSLPKRFLRLQRLLRQQTYLEWPADEQKRRLFWSSLKALLRPADSNAVLRRVAQDLAGLSQHQTGADQ